MPETFDIDAAFAKLERDIGHTTHPPGAAHAVRGARRRRRTTFGAALAGVALVAGAAAVGVGIRHDDAVVPTDHLPAPAAFDGPHLSAATSGWTPEWGPVTDAGRFKVSQTFGGPCLFLPGHGRSGILELSNSHVDVALAAMSDYGSKTVEEATDWLRIERQLAGCHGAQQVSSFSDPSGALGHTYRIDPAPADSAPEYLWIVSTGREIGVLKIFAQSDALPTGNDRPVAQVLLAAIQDPESYVDLTGGQSNTAVSVDEGAFSRALGSWRSGWSRAADRHAAPLVSPCYTQRWLHASRSSERMPLGGNGHQAEAVFDSAAAARAAARSLVDALRACGDAGYSVTTSLDNPRSMLVVASGPSVVWVAQHDDGVSVVRVPSLGTAPPQQVTTHVGGLMLAAITALSAESG